MTKVRCKRCGTVVHIGDVKFDHAQKDYVCLRCYNQSPTSIRDKKVDKKLVEPARVDFNKVKYACSNCGYSFMRSSTFDIRNECPNCGRATIRIQRPKAKISEV